MTLGRLNYPWTFNASVITGTNDTAGWIGFLFSRKKHPFSNAFHLPHEQRLPSRLLLFQCNHDPKGPCGFLENLVAERVGWRKRGVSFVCDSSCRRIEPNQRYVLPF